MSAQNILTCVIFTLILGSNASVYNRRSQGTSQGNIGSVARDESFNFNSQTFGDSVNNGIGNVINAVADLQGTGNQLTRRSQGDSTGDVGSVARDESVNFNSKSFGDAANNGVGNIINPIASLQGVGNQGLFRRSQVDSHGDIGSVARDESFNFNSQTFGDSVNNGIGNVINAVADLQGTGNQFTRRSQVGSQGNIGSVARDESFNFNSETLGDSVNNGLFNVINPVISAQGTGNQLSRRAQVDDASSVGVNNRDQSTNVGSTNFGDVLNSGLSNGINIVDKTNGVNSNQLTRRSLEVTNSGTNTVFNDKSVKFANLVQNDSVNQDFDNGFDVSRFDRSRFVKRSLGVDNSGTNTVVNDKSVKVANFDENTSWNQAFGNNGFFGH